MVFFEFDFQHPHGSLGKLMNALDERHEDVADWKRLRYFMCIFISDLAGPGEHQ